MRVEFDDDDLRRLFEDPAFRLTRLGADLTRAFRKKVGFLVNANDVRDLYAMTSLHFEQLEGSRTGQHSIRLNRQWRLILRLAKDAKGTTVAVVEIVDYH